MRVAFVPRSAEIKPLFLRFVKNYIFQILWHPFKIHSDDRNYIINMAAQFEEWTLGLKSQLWVWRVIFGKFDESALDLALWVWRVNFGFDESSLANLTSQLRI